MSAVETGLSALATLAGPWFLYRGFQALRVQQLMRNTPTARVRSMAMGTVEVNGTLLPRSRVVAPFSNRPCVWWEVDIQAQSSRSKTGHRTWQTMHHASSGQPFFLRDETGVALVYPQGADCRVPYDVSEDTHGLGVPDLYMEFMKSRNLGLRGMWALAPMRFRERRLEEGQHVYVLGRACPKSVARSVSFDEEALEATGTDSYGAAHVRSLDQESCGVIRRGPRDPAFIISTTSELNETFVYGFKAFAGLVGGPLLAIFGVWCLLELARTGSLLK